MYLIYAFTYLLFLPLFLYIIISKLYYFYLYNKFDEINNHYKIAFEFKDMGKTKWKISNKFLE